MINAGSISIVIFTDEHPLFGDTGRQAPFPLYTNRTTFWGPVGGFAELSFASIRLDWNPPLQAQMRKKY